MRMCVNRTADANKLGHLPELCHLLDLQFLGASNMSLTQLPGCVYELPQLFNINLEANHLTVLGMELLHPPTPVWAVGAALDSSPPWGQGLMLLGHNPVCTNDTTLNQSGVTVGSGRWHIKCEPECAVGCASTSWPLEGHEGHEGISHFQNWTNDNECDSSCNVQSCQWDGGDCQVP